MEICFKPIDVDKDFGHCIEFRRDSFYCSFHTYEGYEESITHYKTRVCQRIQEEQWHYFHIWDEALLIGQLEFRSFSELPNTGYVHLVYVIPAYRGEGIADLAQKFILDTLISQGCDQAMLSVSRTNRRAVKHYKKHGWSYLQPNPKHDVTDFYIRKLQSH